MEEVQLIPFSQLIFAWLFSFIGWFIVVKLQLSRSLDGSAFMGPIGMFWSKPVIEFYFWLMLIVSSIGLVLGKPKFQTTTPINQMMYIFIIFIIP